MDKRKGSLRAMSPMVCGFKTYRSLWNQWVWTQPTAEIFMLRGFESHPLYQIQANCGILSTDKPVEIFVFLILLVSNARYFVLFQKLFLPLIQLYPCFCLYAIFKNVSEALPVSSLEGCYHSISVNSSSMSGFNAGKRFVDVRHNMSISTPKYSWANLSRIPAMSFHLIKGYSCFTSAGICFVASPII
jgi:hypothetical protein